MSICLFYALQRMENELKEERQKYGRPREWIQLKSTKTVKPNKMVKYTVKIPAYNNYDYGIGFMSQWSWMSLNNTKIRKVIKPNGDYYYIVAPATKENCAPFIKINKLGDVFAHDDKIFKSCKKVDLDFYYKDIIKHVKKLNGLFFPYTQDEINEIKNKGFFKKFGKFLRKIIKK